MNPTDSGEFLAQTAQFTALEKMQDVADQTAALLATQIAFGASGMVGKTVTYLDDGRHRPSPASSTRCTFDVDRPDARGRRHRACSLGQVAVRLRHRQPPPHPTA